MITCNKKTHLVIIIPRLSTNYEVVNMAKPHIIVIVVVVDVAVVIGGGCNRHMTAAASNWL